MKPPISPLLLNIVLGAFVAGWIASLLAAIFVKGYTPPPGLNESMIAIVTAFFVAQQRLKDDDEKKDDDKKPPTTTEDV